MFSPPRGYFNSRPRVGGDLAHSPRRLRPPCISTPAPAWGRPSMRIMPSMVNRIFQLLPPRGGRPAYGFSGFRQNRISTPAPAWGATFEASTAVNAPPIFQLPPPRGGRHARGLGSLYIGFISTPAPAWGATRRYRFKEASTYFNSRPRVGGDTFPSEYCSS